MRNTDRGETYRILYLLKYIHDKKRYKKSKCFVFIILANVGIEKLAFSQIFNWAFLDFKDLKIMKVGKFKAFYNCHLYVLLNKTDYNKENNDKNYSA